MLQESVGPIFGNSVLSPMANLSQKVGKASQSIAMTFRYPEDFLV
jgi:hypothetical protein